MVTTVDDISVTISLDEENPPSYNEVFNIFTDTRLPTYAEQLNNSQPQGGNKTRLPSYKEVQPNRNQRSDEIFVIFDYDEKSVKNQLRCPSEARTNSDTISVRSESTTRNTSPSPSTNNRRRRSRATEKEGISCCAKWALALTITAIIVLMIMF